MKIKLIEIAHGRSGDKGDTANIGLIAREERFYPIIVKYITAEKVKEYFGSMVKGEVVRYELPNLWGLNFLLKNALGGGGTKSLMHDAQGKTFASALLRMELETEEHIEF